MIEQHAILPPSSAGAWVHCSGWPLMNATYPELEPTQDSLDGTASHEVGYHMIGQALQSAHMPDPAFYVDRPATNGVIVTEEMAEAAEVYALHVIETCRRAYVFGGDAIGLEARLHMPQVHQQNWGTCDAFLFDSKSLTLHIWDYKFGHRWVDEYENWQLINYYAGLVNRYAINGNTDQRLKVHFHVIQPRAYHGPGGSIRTWDVIASDLRGYVNRLHTAAEAAMGPNPLFKAGAHCSDCPGRYACPATTKSAWSLYEHATAARPRELNPGQLGTALMFVRQALKRLENIETGMAEQVEHLIRQGQSVPGYSVEPTKGRETWNAEPETVINTGRLLGFDLSKPGLKTPAQARKLGMAPDVVKAFSHEPTKGVRVVPDKTNKAKRLFSQ